MRKEIEALGCSHIIVSSEHIAPVCGIRRVSRRPSNALVAGRWFPELIGPLIPPLAAATSDQAAPLTVTQAVEIAARLWEIRTEQLNEALRRREMAGQKTRPATRPTGVAAAVAE